MQAFTAKGLKEQWVITHNGNILDKIVSKTTDRMVMRKHTTTTYLQGGKALPAFHAEKKKATSKGMEVSNFDRTVGEPKIVEVEAVVRPKREKILGQRYALES